MTLPGLNASRGTPRSRAGTPPRSPLRSSPELALPPAVAPEIRELLRRCLEKDPEARLAGITEARATLAQPRGAGGPSTASAYIAPPVTPQNLPRQLTSFVGREKEVADCERLLQHARLLTLTGAGGCGKTRLALRLAERLLANHPGGVWFVDLAPLADPERVPHVVAAAVGVREVPGKTPEQTLCEALASRRALLVLDNCEHVLGACAGLAAALLSSCPELALLATSREGLGVAGEQVYAVPTLSVPPAGVEPSAARLAPFEAVALFVDRAALVQPGFALTDARAPAVAEICRRLDGIPLAIELAAARNRVLGVEEIRSMLDDRFRLLTGGSRTALPRHQTLRATLQWSYDHLEPAEQKLFRSLAVFAGGWTLEAAAEVCGAGADAFFEVLDLLARLVDKSLVIVEHRATGEARYRFLETMRQYALEKLDDQGEAEALRARHLEHFLAVAEAAEPKLWGRDQAAWLARLEVEHENMNAALAWCNRAESGAELAECVRLVRELGAKLRGAYAFEAAAALAKSLGEAGRAARLYGAAEALRESLGAPPDPSWRDAQAGIIAAIRQELSEGAFARRWASGRSLGFESAHEYALEWLERGAGTRAPAAR